MNGPSQPQLDELVRRIRVVVNPLRIVLFGSAARGEWRENSDLDVLVVVPDGTDRRRATQRMYLAMIGVGCPVDIVVVTSGDVLRFGRSRALVIEPALREGKVLYAA